MYFLDLSLQLSCIKVKFDIPSFVSKAMQVRTTISLTSIEAKAKT